MKSDIDQLMKNNKVDVVMVGGAAQHNPSMVYFVGNAHVSEAVLLKKRGSEPVLFHYAMEREEAAKSGLKLVSMNKFPFETLIKEAGGNYTEAMVLRMKKMFEEAGIKTGTVAVYGTEDVGPFYAMVSRLQELMPALHFQGFIRDEILLNAMMTKDAAEIDRIREMGRITVGVVGKTADYLTSQRVKNDILVHKDGSPVTIGEVKNLINLWLAEKGVENPEGTIFAIGRDAGIPHSVGTPTDVLKLGETIVYDIYPCEAGGGYFYDFTRTWTLGYAPYKVLKLYEDVKSTYDTLQRELAVNAHFGKYQARTCELFEALGHPTIAKDPTTEQGYVHSLGHGIGLRVHEMPWSSTLNSSPLNILAPGTTFTLEPGLYYPEQGMGVRIEDSYVTKSDGSFENLADFPKDLVLPVKMG